MAQTKIKAGLFEGIIGNGADGYFLMSNGDGTMTWSPSIIPPTISSIDYPGSATAADPAGDETITVTGTDFKPGASVTVGGTTAPIVSYISATEITFTTPEKTAGDYDVVVTNTDGGTATSINGISYNGIPAWTTPAGSLGSFASDTTISTITLQAAEPDAGTITFSITNGALPTGLSLAGADIDGTTSIVNADTTYNFTITAVDDESQSTGRAFSITIEKYVLVSSEHFTINTYTGNGSTQSIEGKIGTAASFNGSSSRLQLNINPTASLFSASFWINFNDVTSIQNILGNILGDAYLVGWYLSIGSGKILLVTGSDTSSPWEMVKTFDFVFSTNTWYHLVLVSDGTTSKLYVNNNESTFTVGSVASLNGNSSDIEISFGGSSRVLNGSIDQVRIFNKALSTDNNGVNEITTLYSENNASLTKSTTDIFDDGSGVALYEFEEGAKSTGAKKHYLHVGDAGNQLTSVRINTVDADFTYTRPDGYAEWGGSFDPNNTAYDYLGSSSNVAFTSNNKKWDKFQGNYHHAVWSTNGYSSGKYYVELEFLNPDLIFGLSTSETADTAYNVAPFYNNAITYFSYTANKRIYSSTSVSGGAVLATNDVIGFAVDFDNKTLKYYINNTLVETETLAGYDGTPTDVSFVGTSFQPDLVWTKSRSNALNHTLFDSVRGVTKSLRPNSTTTEQTRSGVTSFDSNGFTIGSDDESGGQNGYTYVSWCWKAADTTTTIAANTVGNTIASDVRANPEAGFSIVKWTGTGADATVGHGLSSAPELILLRPLERDSNWFVYNSTIGNTEYLMLNRDLGSASAVNIWNNTSPTSSVFSLTGYIDTNGLDENIIAYCFHSVDGYQNVGSYSGSGGAGNKQTLGFSPRFIMTKPANVVGAWAIMDTVRPNSNYLLPNTSDAETTADFINFESDGFSFKNSTANGSGNTYIYLAIA